LFVTSGIDHETWIEIAAEAHKGQKDKAGAPPYILHPLRVMLRFDTEKEMTVAVLQDVVEDSSWTGEKLRREGFSEEIVEAVECVTKVEGESYEDFVQRSKSNSLARKVKIADLEDNMNLLRISELSGEVLQRQERYHRAWRVLADADISSGQQ
jgi:(p)ppGpp synthase/HD superfamily hydrolase